MKTSPRYEVAFSNHKIYCDFLEPSKSNFLYFGIVHDSNKRFAEFIISVSGSLPVKFGNKIFPEKNFISPKDVSSNFRGTPLKNFPV